MDDREFAQQADGVLAHIEAVLEAAEDELDFELGPGGVLEIEFSNGSKMVINRHAIAKEIWVAARSGGFHFRWDGSAWLDTRTGEGLMPLLSRLVMEQGGIQLEF